MEARITVAALCLLFGTVAAKTSMVELSRQWKRDFGWEVVCSWNLYANDSLQSVRLYKADQQFMIYRPERDGPKRSAIMRLPTMEFEAHCSESDRNGVTGFCVMILEILQPVTEDLSYGCEVSGERPTFITEMKSIVIEALVPPTGASVKKVSENDETGRVTVNCTSAGLPAPYLVWTIGDQKVPAEFSSSSWNFTSKLYHVWSSLSYTPDGVSNAVCTPETVKSGKVLKGRSAQYNGAVNLRGTASVIIFLVFLALSR